MGFHRLEVVEPRVKVLRLNKGTKKEGFHQRSIGGDLGKSRASSLGSVLRLPTVSTTLQELWIFPTLVYSYIWADFGIDCGMVLCHILGWFCGLNWEDIVAGGKGLFRDGFGSKWRVLELLRSSLAHNCVALHPFKPQTLDDHIFLV